jgi:hypothetical protein
MRQFTTRVVIPAMAVATSMLGGQAAHATSEPICEQVSTSGDLTGTQGPFGPCITSPIDVPVVCANVGPNLLPTIEVDAEICVVD